MLLPVVGISTVTLGALLLSIVIVCIHHVLRYYRRISRLPPGPTGYPLIGNVLDLNGKDITTYLESCRQKYGNIFCIKIFHKTLVVISGQDVLNEALIEKGHLFSERPYLSLWRTSGVGYGILGASGEQWKINRKFTVKTFRDFGVGKNVFQNKIHEEIREVLAEVENYKGKPFDISLLLCTAVANVVCSVIFGERFDYNDQEIHEQLKRQNELAESLGLTFGFPALQYIPGDPFQIKMNLDRLSKSRVFVHKYISEHLDTFDENNIRDLIHAYIKQMKSSKESGSDETMNEHELTEIGIDLLAAGSETSATSLRWGLVYLLGNPDFQEKLYNEVQGGIPSDRLPNIDDKVQMPLMDATVLEILRLGNVTPIGFPHAVIEDCELRGHTIPKDAFVVTFLQRTLYDEKIWGDPMTFRPSRFITDEGKTKKEHIITFSLGRRSCIGESLAKMEIFLFLSALVQRFKFEIPDGEEPPSLDFVTGVTRAPKPFILKAIKR